MVSSGLGSVDILVEAKSRGLTFVVSADVIADLQQRGADDLLLNWLGLYSVELQPLYSTALSDQQQRRFQRVVQVCGELLERSPRLLHLYLIRGSAHRAQGQLEPARMDFQQALDLHRQGSRPRILLAEVLIELSRTDEAITHLNWVAEHRSAASMMDWPIAHRLLAAAYLRRHEYRPAAEHLHRALWLSPVPNPESVALLPEQESHLSVLARLLSLCPNPQVASPSDALELASLMKLMATTPDQQLLALLRLAEAQAASGQFEQAVATHKSAEILAGQSDVTTIRERLAEYQMRRLPLLPPDASPPDADTATALPAVSIPAIISRMVPLPIDSTPDNNGKKSLIGKYEVTRGEWSAVMNLSRPLYPDLPIDQISWNDCQEFLKRLNEQSGTDGPRFRLPTVAEWRTVAKGVSMKRDADWLDKQAWSVNRSSRRLHKVGSLPADHAGLHDLHGNVAEWCADSASSPATSPTTEKIVRKVAIGGGYLSSASQCLSESGTSFRVDEAPHGVGLRLIADLGMSAKPSVTSHNNPAAKSGNAGLTRTIELARSTLERETFQRPWLQEKLFTLLYLQAVVRSEHADIDGAAVNLRALIREASDDSLPLVQLARCQLAWIQATRTSATPAQLDEARQVVDTALTRSEFRLWAAYLSQSALLTAEGKFEDAIRRINQAHDLAPIRFKTICEAQREAIQKRQSSLSRTFPITLATDPAAIVGP